DASRDGGVIVARVREYLAWAPQDAVHRFRGRRRNVILRLRDHIPECVWVGRDVERNFRRGNFDPRGRELWLGRRGRWLAGCWFHRQKPDLHRWWNHFDHPVRKAGRQTVNQDSVQTDDE